MNKTPRYFQPSLGTGAHPQLKLVIYHFKAESLGLKLGGADPRPAVSNRPSACWRSRSDEGVRTGSSRRNGDAILRYPSWRLLTTDLQHEWGQGTTLVESYTHLEHVLTSCRVYEHSSNSASVVLYFSLSYEIQSLGTAGVFNSQS